jgi:hypothetical protein
MPAMGFLDDTQTASVLTYIRREWDHTAAPVTPETVRQLRDTTSTRTESSELVTGVWEDGRMGILHGLRKGPTPHRVIVFGSKAVVEQKVGASDYAPLVAEIVNFFQTGVPPGERRGNHQYVRLYGSCRRKQTSGWSPRLHRRRSRQSHRITLSR